MLVGQPELRKRLSNYRLAQISQRFAVNYHLQALSKAETDRYISHRLRVAEGSPDIFSKDARDLIYRASAGIPRSINLICDSALIYGMADDLETINADTVINAIKELNIMGILRSSQVKPLPLSSASDGGGAGQIADRLQKIEAGIKILQKQNKLLATYIDKMNLKFNKQLLARLKELISDGRKSSEKLIEEDNQLRLELNLLNDSNELSDNRQTNHENEELNSEKKRISGSNANKKFISIRKLWND